MPDTCNRFKEEEIILAELSKASFDERLRDFYRGRRKSNMKEIWSVPW